MISLLSTKFGIGPKYLVSAMRDRALANNIAMRTINVVYSNVLDVVCFSHTLDLVGKYFKLPNLTEFLNNWLLLFSHSVKCKFLWQEQTGKTMATYSHTRWWSKWEIMSQIWYSLEMLSHSCKKYRYWFFYKTKTASFL